MHTKPDVTPITSAGPYTADRKFFDTPGKKKLKWFLLLILLPPAWPFLFVWLILKIPEASRRQNARIAALHTFADVNHFTYEGTKPIWKSTEAIPYSGQVNLPYKGAELGVLSDKMAGTLGGWQFEYIAGTITIPPASLSDGVRAQPTDLERFITIFCLHTPSPVPTLFVNSKFNNTIETSLPLDIREPYQYRLEGNFPHYYTVSGESGEQIDIYTLLTPEVMQTLIAHNRYDVWFHGNDVLLITYGGSRADYFGGLPAALETAQTLVTEVDRFARAGLHERYTHG